MPGELIVNVKGLGLLKLKEFGNDIYESSDSFTRYVRSGGNSFK